MSAAGVGEMRLIVRAGEPAAVVRALGEVSATGARVLTALLRATARAITANELAREAGVRRADVMPVVQELIDGGQLRGEYRPGLGAGTVILELAPDRAETPDRSKTCTLGNGASRRETVDLSLVDLFRTTRDRTEQLGQEGDASKLIPMAERPAKRGLPEDFGLTTDRRTYARQCGIADGWIEDVWESFQAFHRARGTRFLDWHAAWQTWCRREPRWRPEVRTARTVPQAGKYGEGVVIRPQWPKREVAR